MIQMFRLFSTLIIVVVTSGAMADQVSDPSELPVLESQSVRSVVDGDTLVLSDGREVRLTGIQAPKLPLGRANFPTWPLAPEAKSALETLSVGHAVKLHIDGNSEDRYQRVLAHPVNSDGIWLQGHMVRLGLARVYTFPDNRRLAHTLLDIEATARTQRNGIWALPFYAIRSADPEVLERDFGTFQLVEGRVTDVAKVRSRIYVNFGDDYRTDFTISVDRSAWPLFDDAGVDLLSMEGRRLRVRGWIKDFNGPLVDVTHPEQIEWLSR